MARYVRDPQLRQFQEAIRAEVARVGDLAPDTGFVIYAIRDPTKVDARWGHEDGPPIYVGQTRQLRVRADDHMRDGGESYASSRCKAGMLKGIMTQWRVPKFEILDTAPTHLTSLIAETVWARRFNWLGYELTNKWPEHRSAEPPQGLQSIPRERFAYLTVSDAQQDEVAVVLECRKCDLHRSVNLDTLQANPRLSSLRSLKLRCPDCGGSLVRIVPPDPASWQWRDYRPRPMPPRRSLP
jgi:hypothetical protein